MTPLVNPLTLSVAKKKKKKNYFPVNVLHKAEKKNINYNSWLIYINIIRRNKIFPSGESNPGRRGESAES